MRLITLATDGPPPRVSLKTAQRWKHAGRAPTIAAELLQIKASADLGALAASWTEFRIHAGTVWTPENYQLTPGDIRAIPYRAQQLRDYERELARPRQSVLI